jgi:diguanylate cyclase (GGDEF)-like protein
VRYAARTAEPLVVEDAASDERFAKDPYFADLQCCSLLAIPILSRAELQALLLLENRLIRGAFSGKRLDGVKLIAGQLSVSLDNALVYASLERRVAERTHQLAVANERLEQLSITDPLTGLANRRRWQEAADAQWQQAIDLGQPMGLAVLDIDHFKLYNDNFGHMAGDRCLQRVASALQANVGDTDLSARYGGEEFTILMPNTDLNAAFRLAERVRNSIASLPEPDAQFLNGIVTVSIGVAAMSAHYRPKLEELIEQADAALYRAKGAGRNRTCAASPTV